MLSVYFHGFSGDSEGLRALAQALPYQNYHLYTMPGFGGTTMTAKERDNVDAYVDRIVRELSERFPSQALHLIGHSHGAMIGFAVASRKNTQVQRLTLINPVRSPRLLCRISSRVTIGASKISPEPALKKVLAQPLLVDLTSRYMTRHESPHGKATVKRMRRNESQNYTKDMLRLAKHVRQFRKKYTSTYVSVPTTIIYGEYDNISGARDHEWYRSHCSDITRVIMHKGGHLRVITQPDEFEGLFTPQGGLA